MSSAINQGYVWMPYIMATTVEPIISDGFYNRKKMRDRLSKINALLGEPDEIYVESIYAEFKPSETISSRYSQCTISPLPFYGKFIV